MNVNPFSYLIEKLKGKVNKSGDTMTGELEVKNVGDSIHINRSNSSTYSGWIKFSNANGERGEISASNLKRPVFTVDGSFEDILTNATYECAWGGTTQIARPSYLGMLIVGGRDGYGFAVYVVNGANEYVTLSNVNGTVTNVSVSTTSVSITLRGSGYGTKCKIEALLL